MEAKRAMVPEIDHTAGVSLRRLLPNAEFCGARDVLATGCSADSRNLRPGEVFVALVGTHGDGHDYVDEAIAAGASAILSERLLPVGVPVCVVTDTRVAYGKLCQALAGNPSKQLKLIGVTGTNGKTTTTHLIASILEAASQSVGVLGTLGYSDGFQQEPAPLTTPTAPMLAHWLSRMVDNACTHAVMEVSSHALVQGRVAGAEFDAACVTNVRRDHLDYHGSLANYRAAKARLFEHLAPEALVVLNADDPVSMTYLPSLDRPVLTIGLDESCEISGTVIERLRSEQTFLLTAGSDTVSVRTQMIGDHHVYNCLTATALCLGYGIDLMTIVRGLEAVTKIPGRLERIECGQSFGVFVDYAHTPDALTVALETLRDVTEGRVICVFGAGGERDKAKRPLMGQAVEEKADVAIVTTDNPRSEHPEAIADQIVQGFKRPHTVLQIADRTEAIHRALQLARPGDSVLIAGKGHEDYQLIGSQRLAHDDREVARRWLYNLAANWPAEWSGNDYMRIGNS